MSLTSTGSEKQSSLAWYLRRLQNMSLAEIPHRIKELFLRQVGRTAYVIERDQRLPEALSHQDLPELPFNLTGLAKRLSPADKSELEKDVDRICRHQLTLLGQQWPEGASCDWSLDPDSGEHWRWHEYAFDIPRRSGQGPGDVKFVWELSRLQHLQVLALGAYVLGRDDARNLCVEYLDAWICDNPPYQGLGYACGIELASRVVSMLFIVSCLGASTFSEAMTVRLWRTLIVHGRWIARFPSLHSSANNHLVAESAALFVLGSVAPQCPDASYWQETGWSRLVTESGRQILSDGVGAEQSPTYLAYTMEWLLLARVVYSSTKNIAETALDDALSRGASFIALIADAKGNVPFVGDCDEGVVLRPKLKESNYPVSVVTAIAGCLQSGELLHPAFVADGRSHLLTSNALPDSGLALESALFPDGGYSVIRSVGQGKEVYLLLDHGPLGFAETAAHGHADALAVWLHIDGQPILGDFGTYRYFADAGWRAWARSTAAHNTVEVDGLSQSEMTAQFNWQRRAAAQLLHHDLRGQEQSCSASHDGYLSTLGVKHERRVEVEGGSFVQIEDRITGPGAHMLRLNFHFSAEVEIELLQDDKFAIRIGKELIATIMFDCPGMDSSALRQDGEMQPGPGAISPEYNRLRPAWSIIVSGSVQLPFTCQTTINVIQPESSRLN
jgi:uncharacterized heparinase superfamily protein